MSDRAVSSTAPTRDLEAIWHDLECGAYVADLPLWQGLAARQGSPVLELGAGTGRVSIALARRGHRVFALDRDPRLLSELVGRAGDLDVKTVVADARAFALEVRFSLCLAPMQIIQLLGGAAGRAAMLRCVARHLRPGGLLAIALSSELELWSAADGAAPPLPDACELDGTVYFSQPTAVRGEALGAVLERRRETVSPDGRRVAELNCIRLDHLGADQLEREGVAAGFIEAGRTTIPATRDYTSSEVVTLRLEAGHAVGI